MIIHQRTVDNFWKKVNVIYYDDGTPNLNVCWEWMAYKDKDGYGTFGMNGKTIKAHRASYILNVHQQDIPSNILVCHSCDNPSCINPKHLFLGTVIDNNSDRNNKNRQAKGDTCKLSTLTEEQVMQLITEIWNNKYTNVYEIAKIYHISHSVIRKLLNGEHWKHITDKLQIPLEEIKRKIINPDGKKIRNEDIPKIKELYNSGMSQLKISKIFGVSRPTISEYLKK